MTLDLLAVLDGVSEGVRGIALEAVRNIALACRYRCTHGSGECFVGDVAVVGCIVITVHSLLGADSQTLDGVQLLECIQHQSQVVLLVAAVLVNEAGMSQTAVLQLVCTVAPDDVTLIIKRVIVGSIVRQGQTREDHGVRGVEVACLSLVVLLVRVGTEVSLYTSLEPTVQASLHVGTQSLTVHLGLLDQTLLAVVVERQVVVDILATAGQGCVYGVGGSIVAQNLVAPVGADAVVVYQVLDALANGLADHVAELDVLLRVHHLQTVGYGSRETVLTLYNQIGLLVQLTLLAGDDDNAVSSTRTVDGGRGSILKNGDVLDVAGVQCVEHCRRNGSAVQNEQRCAAGVDRVDTTQTDRGAL